VKKTVIFIVSVSAFVDAVKKVINPSYLFSTATLSAGFGALYTLISTVQEFLVPRSCTSPGVTPIAGSGE
jgi:hypothetical protein